MVLNLLIFIPTWRLEISYHKQMEQLARKIISIDPFYFRDKRIKEDPSLRRYIDTIGDRSVDLSEEKIELVERLKAEFEELEQNRPVYKWGSKPDRWNIITAVTSAFLHRSWIHLLGNFLFLWMVGCNIEDRWGPWFFALFYILGSIAASGADALGRMGSSIPMVGASGAVAALMGAFLLRYYNTRIRFFLWIFIYIRTFHAPAYIMLPLWFVREILFASSGLQAGVANWAHIGGFVFGALAGLVLWVSGLEDKYFVPRYSLDGEEHEVPEGYQLAQELLGRGEREEAKKKLISTAAQHGGYLPAYLTLGKIYAEDKNKTELIKVTEAIIKHCFASNELHIAMEAFQRMIKIFPDASLSPVYQFRMASALTSTGELHQEACWAYRNLAATYPNEMLAQKSLLTCADLLTDKLGMHENAVRMYNHFLKHYSSGPLEGRAKDGLKKARKAMGDPTI